MALTNHNPFPLTARQRHVTVVGGRVHILELDDADPVLVDVIQAAVDPDAICIALLHVGARAVQSAGVSLDTDVLDRRIATMTDSVQEQTDEALKRLGAVLEGALSADGTLPASLDKHRDQLEQLLGSTFDPDSKSSVLSLFERALTDAKVAMVGDVKALVSADGEASPLALLKRTLLRDLKDVVTEQGRIVQEAVREVSEKIAISSAVAPVIAITTAKGFTYEDVVHARLEQIATHHGDLAEQTGKEPGMAGTNKGDEVVTLARSDTHGLEARVVFEAKAQKLSSRKTQEELAAAIANRGALAGVMVFADQAQAPTTLPFSYADDRAIVVFDSEAGDDGALRLAYMWARWVARRKLTDDAGAEFDHEQIAAEIDRARLAAARVKTVRSCHSKAHKAIEQASDEVAHLQLEVDDALARLQHLTAGS